MRPDAPAPLRRRGPRPLLLHLATRTAPPPTPDRPPPPEIDRELLAGIAAYRRHPYVRDLPTRPRSGTKATAACSTMAAPARRVLFVPSLINRAYVLDLMPGRSMLRWLAAQRGPSAAARLGLARPGRARLHPDRRHRRPPRAALIGGVGEPVILAGYCMGGLLTLAAALRLPDRVRALALLATPWDFHAERRERSASSWPPGCPRSSRCSARPRRCRSTRCQACSPRSSPAAVAAKFRNFGQLDQSSAGRAAFVALEDWLNDGVPLAAPVARECLTGWYGENQPGAGKWRIAGDTVDPAAHRAARPSSPSPPATASSRRKAPRRCRSPYTRRRRCTDRPPAISA